VSKEFPCPECDESDPESCRLYGTGVHPRKVGLRMGFGAGLSPTPQMSAFLNSGNASVFQTDKSAADYAEGQRIIREGGSL